MRWIRTAVGASIVVAVPLLARLEPSATSTTTVVPVADAFVLADTPGDNRGGADVLRVSGGGKVAYVRFDVLPLAGGATVRSATLRLYGMGASRCDPGLEVLRAAADGWDEGSVSWNDQPGTVGATLAVATWSEAGYRELDVTPAVTGSGPVTFALRHPEACDATVADAFASREAETGFRPELVVETDPTAAPTAACSDGIDDDNDGLLDTADPGCTGATDPSETQAADAVVVVAAGDIACDPAGHGSDGSNPEVCQYAATAELLAGADAVLPLGDLQYPDGTLDQFQGAYDPTWGVQAPISYPAVGNHEYHVPGAAGYFDYWSDEGRPTGDRDGGYYSFDLGSWHLISLNSNCSEVSCDDGTPQNDWLEADLAATSSSCVLAFWHHPLFNSGAVHGDSALPGVRELWHDLYAAGADIVLNGHEHNYQRYAKQGPDGLARADGIREFVAGTGGSRLYPLLSAKAPNYETGQDTTFGVLRMHLDEGAYSWEFVAVDGTVTDTGGPVPCN